ncbi:MAG: OsmC family peroxiredoxin [Microbacteriaceae bacterium]|jgi:osmotically inducible protein OsmC|nr:OsmC family peroxiredoxin [Microbacteriaceae bacterium]HPZ34242.1 OsmC family peroxiredoxin [Microbacteriaceae bacterium]HQC93249.1 OsmC family peroxiredoxin [Microbacteriaceae bacterium]
MTVTSEATTVWQGSLTAGSGTVRLDTSGAGTFDVNWRARSEGSTTTTTPEELLAGAHAACFSMALSNALTSNGTPPEKVESTAAVTFKPGTGITGSHLRVAASVPGITADDFARIANDAKTNCPVSKALAGVPITLEATLA